MALLAKSGEINGDMFDRFSLLHAGFGFLLGKAGLSLTATTVAAVTWEFMERDLKAKYPEFFPHPSQDSLLNATGDVLSTGAGWYLATSR